MKRRNGPRMSNLSVSFPETDQELARVVAEIEPCMNYSEEDRKNLWYTRSDYHFARSSARVIAKESERYGHSKQLEGVYISAFQQQAQDALNLWALHGHSRRGLERWANSRHGHVRKDDQYMYQQGVLRAQQEIKLKDSCGGDKQAQAERLREVGFILSRKSRLFAQMMGEADAQAARWEFGMIEPGASGVNNASNTMRMTIPPHHKKKNLGLSGSIPPAQRKVNRIADLPSRAIHHSPRRVVSAAGPATRSSSSSAGTNAPKISIKTRTAGRVPRMA